LLFRKSFIALNKRIFKSETFIISNSTSVLNRFLGKFSKDLGIDLGTTTTLMYCQDKGIVVNEPSVVAVNMRTDEILAVGESAKKMLGKTPSHIQAIKPLVDGVISDFEVTEKMLKYFIDRVHGEGFMLMPRPRVVIGIPLDITEVEKKAVEDAVKSAGAREVHLVEESMAAAVGARLPVTEAMATMIVDIGGGTTEIAVISLSGVVNWKTLRIGGNELDNNITQYVREEFNILIGEQLAEQIKINVGSAAALKDKLTMNIRGRDLVNGLPRSLEINDGQIHEAIAKTLNQIIESIKITLETTPPELISDIYEHGIIITGGGALLRGFDKEIAQATKTPVRIAEDPLTCVVRGTGILLSDPELLAKVSSPNTEQMR
jgi:rod shape-determining protein MreB